MQLYGLDFTSAPSAKKPITVARCEFQHETLTLLELIALPDFVAFEAFLQREGPWVAALDLPFSMPLSWLRDMDWPTDWQASVRFIETLTLPGFCQAIKAYRQGQPAGKKHHFRAIDRKAGACSPMTIDYTPVGRMFFQAMPRLLASGVQVLPFMSPAQGRNARIAVEGYPALIARRLAPKQSYKSDTPKQQDGARLQTRKQMISALKADFLEEEFGFPLNLNGQERALLSDPTGDRLDALFCAIQAAWAYQRKEHQFGLPQTPEAAEGWIADPFVSEGAAFSVFGSK